MVQQIWASRVVDFINSHNCFVMDIRSEDDFRKGHLPKAVHMDIEDIKSGEFQIAKSTPVVVYCSEGSESIQAARLLSMKGYYVYNLAGGYDAFWRNKNKERGKGIK